MSSKDSAVYKRTWRERLNYAWEPVVGSFSIPTFFGATALEILGQTFEWHERLAIFFKTDMFTVLTINIVVYLIIAGLATRSVFLIAERCGKAEEDCQKAKEASRSQVEAFSCLHHVIHLTRDDLLSADNFSKLIGLDEQQSTEQLWKTWNSQLAILQKTMRCLTGSECQVCIKAIRTGRGPNGTDGLVTLCYGPASSLERRQNSLVLPSNQGIASEAIITRKIAHSDDILKDDRFWPREDRDKHAQDYRTVVSAPIIVNGQIEGVLCLDWKEPNRYLPSDHGHVIAAFSDMMSTACYLHQLSRILK